MYTYLLIDDEELTRKGTQKKLEPLSHLIQCIGEAENGEEALVKIDALNPNLVIMDMNMPIMDGTQLLPIITEKYPSKQVIIISSYKDYEYMHQAIKANAVDYILKPFGKEDIQNSVMRAIARIENQSSMQQQIISSESQKEAVEFEYDTQLLNNMLMGYHSSSSKLISNRLSYINDTHEFILITLHSSDPLNEKDMQDFLEENRFGDLAVYLQNENSPHLGFLIFFISEGSALNAPSFCKQIVRNLIDRYDGILCTLNFGISAQHADISELHRAFLETVSALNTRCVGENFKHYFFTEETPERIMLIWPRREEFLFRLESGLSEEVHDLILELFQFLRETAAPLSDIKHYCFQLSFLTQNIVAQYVEQVKSHSSTLSMQNMLNTMFTIGELQKYYLQFFGNITEIFKECNIYSNSDVIVNVKTYVQKNYDKDLNLEFLSSLFYLNRSYLSHLFKEKTGQNFVDYLNDIRIEKAKELLNETDKKMYSIAKAVGYDNIKYFFRVFKRKTGITPEQYRKQNGLQ